MVWPSWWSEEAESSASARAELRFTLARQLGLDPRALVESDEPKFVWNDASFKGLSATSELERAAIVSYGTSLAATLLNAVPDVGPLPDLDPSRVRASILKSSQVVSLQDLLILCWGIGVPVVHLKVFPLDAKRMCAMAVRVRRRYAILLAKESNYPAQVAYYIGHELGHIARGHLQSKSAVVDLEDPLSETRGSDADEKEADRYALELLTGDPEPVVTTQQEKFTGAALAKTALARAAELGIDPGTLALCFGHNTKRWKEVFAALKKIYAGFPAVGPALNQIAFTSQLKLEDLPEEAQEYLRSATGSP